VDVIKHFYTAPAATLDATPPAATWQATQCPGAPAWCLVVVEHWRDHAAQDAWEGLPNVTEHYIENLGQPAPAAAVQAFAPWGATSGLTLRQLFSLIRQHWPACRL
jgi:hypothetical protein